MVAAVVVKEEVMIPSARQVIAVMMKTRTFMVSPSISILTSRLKGSLICLCLKQ